MIKLFKKSYDGGPDSGVTGYWLIEWKEAFSIVLLRFNKGSREAFHSHAFNAITWWLKGNVQEEYLDGKGRPWSPSWKPKLTPKNCFHRIVAYDVTWALSFRGPWDSTWQESKQGVTTTLTHGRVSVYQEIN